MDHLSSNTAWTHSEPRRESTDAPVRDLQRSDADSLLKLEETSPPQPLRSLTELEESPPGPSVFSHSLCPSAHHLPNLQPSLYFPASVHQDKHNPAFSSNINPVTLFSDVNPSFLVRSHSAPGFNPPWPVLVPRLSPSGLKPFCPVCRPPLSFSVPCDASVRALVAREDSSRVFRPLLKVFPAYQLMRTDAKRRCLRRSSGKVRKTKRCTKELPLQDLAESALTEYSQVMDALESKVTDGSEVTDEEDVCALFLKQLLNDSESMTEAGFDMDYINSLLSSDQNISDVFKDNPEPVAGCSDWTRSTVPETQSSSPSVVQHDLSPFNATNLLLSEDPMMQNISVSFQDNAKDQNAFQMFSEPLLANPESPMDLDSSVQEMLHPGLQDFGPEADGNQKHKTLCVDELDFATQSNCFSLQNYKSHHATFPHTVKHDSEPPETPEEDGEENTPVGPKTQKYMNKGSSKGSNKMDLDIPNDSQGMRMDCNKQTNLKESPKIDQIEEININEHKKLKRKHGRRKIAPRTSSKLDDKDKKRVETAKYQPGKMNKMNVFMKHEAREQETDFIKINVKRVELQKLTKVTSSDIRKIRAQHLDDKFERRQKLRKVGKRQTTKTKKRQCKNISMC